jgi:16S rRNA (adenine1518-N6/adenine1519-N6)-dimethyltransferase
MRENETRINKVTAKKHLGQHFLTDDSIAKNIADLLIDDLDGVIEIGPGTGILTKHLYEKWGSKLVCVEIDRESVAYLKQQGWAQGLTVVEGDFLGMDLKELPINGRIAVIGNFPYNISTQIVFKVLEGEYTVVQFAGMFQKEVAKRFCAIHGNKEYGITSVLLQAYYGCTYEFSVNEGSFNPPPKVKSGVINCLLLDEKKDFEFRQLQIVVKQAFSQRRKTMSNAMKSLLSSHKNMVFPEEWKSLRAEALSVQQFKELAIFFSEATH